MSLPYGSKRKKKKTTFLFVLNILNFALGTRISSSLILNSLNCWAVEYCGHVMFYYFLLADNSGC